jgi:phosphoglucose isomerase-like protein
MRIEARTIGCGLPDESPRDDGALLFTDYHSETTMPDPASPPLDLPGLALGDADVAYGEAVTRARDEGWAERLFNRDPSLWSSDARVQAAISDRLGWLDAAEHFSEHIPDLEAFGQGIRAAGFRTAVVMGMGGSSLAPEVLARTFGSAPGGLALEILDSTDPDAVNRLIDSLDPLSTLWIVASKSGTTTEPLAFQAAAWARLKEALEANHSEQSPGELMIAITDPGKSAKAIPHHDELREIFLNPPDIGGRYSALTYVGLVPAVLMGLDLDPPLANASAMLHRSRDPEPSRNPGVSLGLAMGVLARAGRDKLTFLPDPEIASFGSWAEQLIAESTGKHGTGIVPVDLEPLGAAGSYRSDRVFVRLSIAGSAGLAGADDLVDSLQASGHPVIRIGLAGKIDLAGEFVRWEIATAIAGAVLGIDPFDQPNVEEAKELTRRVLATHVAVDLPDPEIPGGWGAASDVEVPKPEIVPVLASGDGIVLVGDAPLRLTSGDGTLVGELRRHLARRKANSYLAIQAFIAPDPARDAVIARIRTLLRDRTGRATTAGYGPRFLHSTGQLHKGGPPTGWFLQLTEDHAQDREIPGWPYTFGQLIEAQAEGDFAAIESHDLPILRVHLGSDPVAGLAALERALAAALADASREG